MMDRATGSGNYLARRGEGWVCGMARYADSEPHHARSEFGAWTYEEMYDPARERLLSIIIEGRPRKETRAKIAAEERFPRLTADHDADYQVALAAGTVRTYLLRSTGGGVEAVRLHLTRTLTVEGPGSVDIIEEDDGEWRYEYCGTLTLVRAGRA